MAMRREGISTISGKIREAAGCCQLTELSETLQVCWALRDGQSLTQVTRHESHSQCAQAKGQRYKGGEERDGEGKKPVHWGSVHTRGTDHHQPHFSQKPRQETVPSPHFPSLLFLPRQGQRRRREADVGPGNPDR